jgi:hypothetical protein
MIILREKHNMLWFKLLQNTRYCGKLNFAAYQLYQVVRWPVSSERWRAADRRRKVKQIFHPSSPAPVRGFIPHPFIVSSPVQMKTSGEEA